MNQGEKTQYLIQNNHEGIIDRETFDKVQKMLKPKSKGVKRGPSKRYDLTGRVACSECGANFHRYKTRGYVTWRCSNRRKSTRLCNMTSVRDEILLKALKQAFIEKHEIDPKSSGKRQVIKLMKNLQNTDVLRDREQNRLRLELEKALFAESMAVLDNKDEKELKDHREAIEKTIAEKEVWWRLVDADDPYRKEALEELGKIKDATNPLKELYKQLDNIKFLRAWMTRIEAKSSFLFSITWVNGEETEVEASEGGDD